MIYYDAGVKAGSSSPAMASRSRPGWLFWLAFVLLIVQGAWVPAAYADGGVVRVGIYQNMPKIFFDDSGRPAGIFVDVIEHIAKSEGWRLQYVKGTWAECLDRLASGNIDLMPDVAYTAEREKLFSFHRESVLSSWAQVYSRPGSGIRSILDLSNKKVSVLEKSIQQTAFEQLVAGFGLKVTIIQLPDFDTVFSTVTAGEADAAVVNCFYGMTHFRRYGLEDTSVIFQPSSLYFAASKTSPKNILNAIDFHLRRMKDDPDSAYSRSIKRWLSEDVRFQIPGWVRAVFGVVAAGLMLSLAGSYFLNRQVQARTLELKQSNEQLEQRVVERTEQLRKAMEQAQAADRIKSAFLATMSHELRTPLNSIIGFTGILLQGLAGQLNEEQKKQMTMVQGSSRHLLALINEILDISKIEAGQLKLSPSTFDARGSIEKMVRMVTPLADKKSLPIHMELPGDLPMLTTDSSRFEQIILNLVNNAVKYTEQGHLLVRCRSDRDQALVIAVSDTGIGIGSEDIARLFQPFHQVDSGLTRKYEGSGLGLSICRKLLDLMGGSIEVESEPGRGSTFTVRLPFSPEGGV